MGEVREGGREEVSGEGRGGVSTGVSACRRGVEGGGGCVKEKFCCICTY